MAATSPPFAPIVHDMELADAEQPLYDRLFDITEEIAAPLLTAALVRVTASEAVVAIQESTRATLQALDLTATTAQQELDEEGQKAWADVYGELRVQLERQLTADGAGQGDAALARELAPEFARAFWSATLYRMRHLTILGVVDAGLLLFIPDNRVEEASIPLLDVQERFNLTSAEFNIVLRRSLESFAKSDSSGSHVRFPLGLAINRADLERRLSVPGPGTGAAALAKRHWTHGDDSPSM